MIINTVTQDQINVEIAEAEIKAMTMFNKTTIVICQLKNGFVIVESSSCVDPENYDAEVGYEICMNRIANKIWELKGFQLADKLYEEKADDKA